MDERFNRKLNRKSHPQIYTFIEETPIANDNDFKKLVVDIEKLFKDSNKGGMITGKDPIRIT